MSDTLALHGGTPVRRAENSWPAWPVFGHTERDLLNQVLESGNWWYGEQVSRFQEAYAAFQGARHCVSCSNGTVALEVALQAIGIESGDEVIVPPYTFIATATAVARMGGTPVFADVDASWCLDPDAVERAVSPRTRAILPVHFGGRFADMDRLLEIADRHGLTVFEDACHTWGGRWKDKGAGTLGIGGAFSFQMSKNITSAEGGAIVSDDGAFAEVCESICNCGRGQGGAWYRHDRVGTNARITEFQAALLNAQMPRVPGQIDLREKNGAMLDAALSAIEGIEPQPGDERITRRSYHLYCFKVDPVRFGCSREHLIVAAKAEGLDISGGYGVPIYRQPAFAEGRHAARYAAAHCPVAEDLCARSAMWLPHQILLGSPSDMEDIVTILQKIKRHAHRLAEG